MDVKTLYEKVIVCTGKNIQLKKFLLCLDDAADILISKYGSRILHANTSYSPLCTLEDECNIRPLFSGAVFCYIVGVLESDESKIKDFYKRADRAYLCLWNSDVRGKRMRGDVW